MSTKITEQAYKLPWKEIDNPNGWIEPTTHCQIICPGCYRGIDQEHHKPKHEELSLLKKQVDWFIKERNVQTISIAGGEPLLYPHLEELIKYCYGNGLRTMLYTNGVGLDKQTLLKLKASGVTQILVHIDRYQERGDLNNLPISKLQEKFCELFREVKGVHLGFIQPISQDYLIEIDRINQLAKENIDVVNLIVYTLYQDICWDDKLKQEINTQLEVRQVIDYLKKIDEFKPGAYLSSEGNPEDLTWVFGIKIGVPNLILGYFSPRLYKLIQQKYRRRNGRFLFISRHHKVNPLKFVKFLWINSTNKYLRKYLKAIFIGSTKSKKIFLQTTLILRGPVKSNGKWDLCYACPDRMINNGKLIPSCILNDIENAHQEFQEVNYE